MEEPIKLYTADEVAEILRVNRDYVYDRIQDGRLKCYRLGRNKRFSWDQVKDFLDMVEKNKHGQE